MRTEKCILCEKAAKDSQDGSDYLTEQVRLYAITSQKKYMDAYFTEADLHLPPRKGAGTASQ